MNEKDVVHNQGDCTKSKNISRLGEEGEKEEEDEEEEGIPVDNDDDRNLSDDSAYIDATQMLTQSQATPPKKPRTVPKRAASCLDTSLSQSQQASSSAKRVRRQPMT